MGAGQISEMIKLAKAVRKRVDREFRRGYRAGADDVKGMGPVDIVRIVEGDLKMSRMVYYRRHGREEVSETYLEGWAQAIEDAHKRASEGKG